MKYPLVSLLVGMIVSFMVSGAALAGEPLDFIQEKVEKVLTILRDPAYQEESAKTAQQDALREVGKQLFSVQELSRRTLARNVRKFSPEQMEEFEDLFPQLLERTYIDRIQAYTDEKVVYGRETMLSSSKAEVETMVVTSTKEIPIDYRLIQGDGKWSVYDVLVEGVSMVKNYRSQFADILKKDPPEELLARLRDKVKEPE